MGGDALLFLGANEKGLSVFAKGFTGLRLIKWSKVEELKVD